MKMAEGAKLQMCYLLHHLCDVQLRHRVESIVAFSFDFVGDLQTVFINLKNLNPLWLDLGLHHIVVNHQN